jgi:hypothetical protein
MPTTASNERLKKGAFILGDLWRKNIRCSEEWSVLVLEEDITTAVDCFCEPKNAFCKAKKQWLTLAWTEELRLPVSGPFGVLETMKGSEWDATGLSVSFDFPGVGVHSIGPKGVMKREDIVKLFDAPDTLGSIVKLMKSFPGMKVEEVTDPVETPAVAEEDGA